MKNGNAAKMLIIPAVGEYLTFIIMTNVDIIAINYKIIRKRMNLRVSQKQRKKSLVHVKKRCLLSKQCMQLSLQPQESLPKNYVRK